MIFNLCFVSCVISFITYNLQTATMNYRFACIPALMIFICCTITHAQTTQQLLDSSEALYSKRNFSESLKLALQAEPLIKADSGEWNHYYATFASQYLGLIYEKAGDYPNSIKWHDKSKEIFERLGDTNSYDYGEMLINSSTVLSDLGAFSEAGKRALAARSIFKDVPLSESLDFASANNSLANSYQYIGNYSEAEFLYIDLLSKFKKLFGDSNVECATMYNNLGAVYGKIGLYDKGIEYTSRAVVSMKNAGADATREYASITTNQGYFYMALDKIDSADKYFLLAGSIFRELHNQYFYADILGLRAGLMVKKKKYKAAESLLLESLSLLRQTSEAPTTIYYKAAYTLCVLYNAKKELLKRDSVVNAMMEKIRLNGRPDFVLYQKIFAVYCNALIRERKYSEAADSLLSFGKETFEYLGRNLPGMTEEQKLVYTNGLYQNFDIQFSMLAAGQNSNASFAENALNSLIKLKGVILQNQEAVTKKMNEGGDKNLQSLYNKWILYKQLLARQYSGDRNKKSKNIDSLENLADAAEKQLALSVAASSKMVSDKETTFKDIAGALKKEEVAVEFVRFNNIKSDDPFVTDYSYGAFIIPAGGAKPYFVKLCSEATLRKIIEKNGAASLAEIYKQPVAGMENEQVKNIYNLIWKPLQVNAGNAKNIYLSPAGLLNIIPFDALPGSNKKMLIDEVNIHYLYGTKSLTARTDDAKQVDNFSVWGGMDYNMKSKTTEKITSVNKDTVDDVLVYAGAATSRGGGKLIPWERLNYSEKEVDAITGLVQHASIKHDVYTGNNATEANFKATRFELPGVLHISTHGFYNREQADANEATSFLYNKLVTQKNPLLNTGLIFSGANDAWLGKPLPDSVEDGILTGYEIANLNLGNIKLVTLSACETGLGIIHATEGIFGLQRAFKQAGADKVIVSLWNVNDKATSEFMIDFYQNMLVNNQSISTAFDNTKHNMRKKYTEPYYWAGFVLLE